MGKGPYKLKKKTSKVNLASPSIVQRQKPNAKFF